MNIFSRFFLKKTPKSLVKVFSHPRSGTHFMEAFLAQNFYPDHNLKIAPITWGHWSNRQSKKEGNPYGQLFGNHYFADRNRNDRPKIYMVRDPRAVAYSVWKTPNFVHESINELSFSEFLKTNIDWYGTPSRQVEPTQTIVEHWIAHVQSWIDLSKENTNVLIITYEDLVEHPYDQYLKIHDQFFSSEERSTENELNTIQSPVGLLPNKATKDSYRTVLSDEDNKCVLEQIPKDLKALCKI